jgi:hypothetical protein
MSISLGWVFRAKLYAIADQQGELVNASQEIGKASQVHLVRVLGSGIAPPPPHPRHMVVSAFKMLGLNRGTIES